MSQWKDNLQGRRYIQTTRHDIGGDPLTSWLGGRRSKNGLLRARHGDVTRDASVLDTADKFGIRKLRKKRVMPPAYKECLRSVRTRDLNVNDPESRLDSIRTTLRLIDGKDRIQKTTVTINKEGSLAELGDNRSQVTRESYSPQTSEKSRPQTDAHVQDPGTPPAPATNRRHLAKHARKRRGMMGAKFKRLAKFLAILFGLWKKHARRVQKFLEHNVDFLDVERPSDLMFDVTEFKTAKQAGVPSDAKRILMKRAKDRTPEEVKRVQVALGNYQPIAEYPLVMTSQMAQRAWYERYTPKRVIIKQGHPPRCYYFILSGSVVITKMDDEGGISKTECFLGRGESFGDLAIVNKVPRESTIISRENVELLVFGDEDYTEIFMSGGLNDPELPLFRSFYCLRGWPTELLADNPDNAILSYFKYVTSALWLYIFSDIGE